MTEGILGGRFPAFWDDPFATGSPDFVG